MSHEKYNIHVVAKSNREADMFLYGYIGGWDTNNGKSFLNEIKKLEGKYDTVNLHIHSGGGAVFEGWAIMNAILTSKIKFIGIVDGMAASMAFMILFACHERKMMRNSMIMAHQASGGGYGNAEDLRNAANLLDKVDNTLFDRIKKVASKTDEEIEKYRNGKDHWFTADEALTEGFINEIIESEEDAPSDFTNWTPEEAFNYYLPKLENNLVNQSQNEKIDQMNKGALIASLGLQGVVATDSDQAVEDAIIKHVKNQNTLVASLQGQVNTLTTSNEELEEQIVAVSVEKMETLLAKAVTDKKITEKQVATYRKIAETSSYEDMKALFDGIVGAKSLRDGLENSQERELPKTIQAKVAARMAAKNQSK